MISAGVGSDAQVLLSVDFEDWHQLVRRRLGACDWRQPGPALARQTEALLALLDELEVRATFFILGVTARSSPELVEAVAARGHEIACHGDQHLPVHRQTPRELAEDLRAARRTVERLTGQTPIGYRAPGFSITGACDWAYGVLAAEGFSYDSSLHDSPRIRGHVSFSRGGPRMLELDGDGELWELPPAVWRVGRARVPVGGASYWSVLPTSLVLRGIVGAGPMAGVYLHPHELDPRRLRAGLHEGVSVSTRARARVRAARRNAARRRAPQVLRAIVGQYQTITYGEAYAQLSGCTGAGS